MSNIKGLVKKVELFERLAVFGDRSSFLKSLAQDGQLQQSNDPAILSTLAKLNDTVGEWQDLPQELKPLYEKVKSFLLSPNKNMNVDVLKDLGNMAKQLAYPRALQSLSADRKQAWVQTVMPLANQLSDLTQKQMQYLNEYKANYTPTPGSGPKDVWKDFAENFKSPAKPVAQADPETVKTLQTFLNNALKSEIIAGKRGPIGIDGQMGKETTLALNDWAKINNVRATDTKDLIDIALGKQNTPSQRV